MRRAKLRALIAQGRVTNAPFRVRGISYRLTVRDLRARTQ
jgi:hypothetical protein